MWNFNTISKKKLNGDQKFTITIKNIDTTYNGSVSATPVEGEEETDTLAPNGTMELSLKVPKGSKLDTVYSAITVTYDNASSEVIEIPVDAVTVNKNLVIDVQTTPVYTVTFNSNGGSAVASQDVTKGDTATKPQDPTKPGFIFEDWYSDAELTTKYNFSTPVNSNITLYANWESNPSQPATLRIVNRGNSVLSYSATPVGGVAETGTIAVGGVVELAQTLTTGETIGDTYSAISAQYGSDEPFVIDTTRVVDAAIIVYEYTDWDEEGKTVTVVNYTDETITLVYRPVGAAEDTTVTIAANGANDLTAPVTQGETVSTAYTSITATWGAAGTYTADLTVVANTDVVYNVGQYTYVITPSDTASSGKIGGYNFPFPGTGNSGNN